MEWMRASVAQLLRSYQRETILYDTKSSQYYNKNARRNALNRIVTDLQEARPNTTMAEVVKKISTLRTQFGQELTKIKKSEQMCIDNEDAIVYTPSVWWFQELEFIKDYIKPRNSLLSVKEEMSTSRDSELHHQQTQSEYEDEDEEEEEEVMVLPNKDGGVNKSYHIKRRAPSPDAPLLEDSTAYSIVQPQSLTLPPAKKVMNFENGAKQHINFEVIDMESLQSSPKVVPRQVGRHEEIGRFVTAQMSQISDDLLFYKTQHEILNVVNKAIIEQLEKNITK